MEPFGQRLRFHSPLNKRDACVMAAPARIAAATAAVSASILSVALPYVPPAAMKLRREWGTPTFVSVRRGVGANSQTPLTERDQIKFPSLPELRILKEFIKCRAADFLEVLIRLQRATGLLLASIVDSERSFCALNHARRLNAFMQMQNTFAGIKPYWQVCNPIAQTMRLLTPETTRPLHIFLPTKMVATTVRKQDR